MVFSGFLMTWFGTVKRFLFSLKPHIKIRCSSYREPRGKVQWLCLLLAACMLVWNYSHVVFICVMIISIIILNLCLSAHRLPVDWYSVTTGNRYTSTKTVIITAGTRNPSSLLSVTSLSWTVLTSAGLGHGWAAVSSRVAAFGSSWRDGRMPACTICAPDISF